MSRPLRCQLWIMIMVGLALFNTSAVASADMAAGWRVSNSLDVLVNKQYPLKPYDYLPPDLIVPDVALAGSSNNPEMQLRRPAALALQELFQAAARNRIKLVLSSGYRSFSDQAVLYHRLLTAGGSAAKEAIAPPGTSEHQTGLAADIILPNYLCAAQGCFAITWAAAWLQANAYRYGFILRYPDYQTARTGYEYEPWHYRYVGVRLARRLQRTGETLETLQHIN